MSKANFLALYAQALKARYQWASDAVKLARFIASARDTLGGANTWNCDGDAIRDAWQAMGCKGKPTLKALRALP